MLEKINHKSAPKEVVNALLTLYHQGKFDDVLSRSSQLIKEYPHTFVLHNIIGAIYFEKGHKEIAIEYFRKVIELRPHHPHAYNNLGATLIDIGKYQEAKSNLKKAIELQPDYAEAYNNLGNVCKEIEEYNEAILVYEKAVELNPQYYEAYNNLGVALGKNEQYKEAIEAYNKAILLKPDFSEAFNNMGIALKEQGKLEEAIEIYNKTLSLKPDYADAYYNIGVAFQDQGKLEEAIEAFNKALSINSDDAEIYNNMGIVLAEMDKLEEAIEVYNKALLQKPDYAEAYNNMGVALKEQGKLDEAIEIFYKTLSLKPDYFEAYYNMGNAIKKQGRLEEAIKAYKKALSIKPDYANAYNNIGFILHYQGKLEKAIEAFKKALSIKPDYAEFHENLSYPLLNSGKIKEGLEEKEWRWKNTKNPEKWRDFSPPVWDGQKSLQGKRILIWCEQGIGDTINWSSRLPLISSEAEHCILECSKKLVPLLTRSFPNIEIKSEDRSRDAQRDEFDFHLPMGSLYRHFIPQIMKNPKLDAFLIPDPVKIKFWTERLKSLGNGPFVGVSWKSQNTSHERMHNYAPISEWAPIFKLNEITYINLQYVDFECDLSKIQNEFGVKLHNFDDLDHYNDLDNVAALCAALDLVVTTKITVPSISAAVGTTTKLANWRQSPWNNILVNPHLQSIDIYERNTWEPWHKVFSKIAKDIFKMKTKVKSR